MTTPRKPKPTLKPLHQRPEPTPPGYPFGYDSHWLDEKGNIILIRSHEFCSSLDITQLKTLCEEYGIERKKYGRLIKRVEGDRRGRDQFLAALTQERRKRHEANNAIKAYRIRLHKWRIANGYDAA
jgi:hypothetical protein